MLTEKQVPYTGPYSLASGPHRSRGPTAKALKIAMKRMQQAPFAGRPNVQFDEHYNQALENALDGVTNAAWDGYGAKRWEAVRALKTARGEWALNKEARDLILTDYARLTGVTLPDLGPLCAGGRSVLDHQLTHKTSRISLYPAFDDGWREGREIIAPEPIVISMKDTSAWPGEAVYAAGDALDWWIGHIDRDHPLGTRFAKGAFIGKIIANSIGGGPHVHVGINVERMLGKGIQLLYGANGDGPDYTYGSPTVREQLERALAA